MNSATDNERSAVATNETPGDAHNEDLIGLLRRFHYGEPQAVAATKPPATGLLPALLNPYRDASTIRYPYPIYLLPVGDRNESVLARSLGEQLTDAAQALAPGDDQASILKDNLPWLEHYLRQNLEGGEPVDAPALIREASAALLEHLALSGSKQETLQADLAALANSIVPGSQFLGYGPSVPLHLMLHAVRHRQHARRERFGEQVRHHVRRLQSILDVEKAKVGGKGTAGGAGSRFFDTDALSGVLDKRVAGSVKMPAERRRRIERALGILENWQDDSVLVLFVGQVPEGGFGQPGIVEFVDSDDPCVTAGVVFEREAANYAEIFAAARIAALEIEDRYDPAVHDSWFDGFDWQAFSDDEMQLVTRVVALVSADYLACDGLSAFSRLLGSRLPVHVLTWVRAYDNPAIRPGEGPFDAYRFELAYLGIGHRQVVVAQTSAARHEDLLSGFVTALDSNRASLHLVNRGTQTSVEKPLLDPWFVASSALESRAHPFVLVNPDAGDHAAERVKFDGNPQADRDWPVRKLEYKSADGETTEMELEFTFADYALLMPALHDHFRTVPAGFESQDLVAIDQYLTLDERASERHVPYVWGIDDQGILLRLVVSRALVFACRDRLNYWRTLQELAGTHNLYVEAAIERVIEEQRAADALEREQLQQAHAEELVNVRSAAAGETIGRLVEVLMGADIPPTADGSLATMPAGAPPVSDLPVEPAAVDETEPMADDETEPVADDEAAGDDDAPSFGGPWLDTAMCTTCDDCMGVNKMMFAYNDDKQAVLTDPTAGPFADLVAAAEICPAKCIHPGDPLDPSEPGLEALIARARPFN